MLLNSSVTLKDDYNELVDDIVGIMSFYNDVEGGQIISVW